ARKRALFHRVERVARLPQVGEKAHQVLFVQQGELDLHRARVKVDVGRLARRGAEQALALDDVAQVEQLALRADAGDRVGPFEAALLAEDVEALQALVDIDLLIHFALFLGDTRQPLVALPALGLRRAEPRLRVAQRASRAPDERRADAEQRGRDGERREQALQ